MRAKKWVHILYFVLLIMLTCFSFFTIFSFGFGPGLEWPIFILLAIMAFVWAKTYVKRLKMSHSYLLMTSGALLAYNSFLSSLIFNPIELQSGWLFIGTPIMMLMIWYIFIYYMNKQKAIHWSIWFLFICLIFYYAIDVTMYYVTNTIM
ncbi:hypothetical protein [Alkalihalobacillus sp. 1P02AB]|uniref:hypothetical protein n=1 Tax=Alkalihalobacillus sp. 1P02AB TaxID=3132260 RepID=UPI0039A50283